MKNSFNDNAETYCKLIDYNLEKLYTTNNFLMQQPASDKLIQHHCQQSNSLITDIYSMVNYNKIAVAIEIANKTNELFQMDRNLSTVMLKLINSRRPYNAEGIAFLKL